MASTPPAGAWLTDEQIADRLATIRHALTNGDLRVRTLAVTATAELERELHAYRAAARVSGGDAVERPQPHYCAWHQDDADDDAMWETTCGHSFVFNDDGPKANGFEFCGYCGRPLVESRTSDPEQAPDEPVPKPASGGEAVEPEHSCLKPGFDRETHRCFACEPVPQPAAQEVESVRYALMCLPEWSADQRAMKRRALDALSRVAPPPGGMRPIVACWLRPPAGAQPPPASQGAKRWS